MLYPLNCFPVQTHQEIHLDSSQTSNYSFLSIKINGLLCIFSFQNITEIFCLNTKEVKTSSITNTNLDPDATGKCSVFHRKAQNWKSLDVLPAQRGNRLNLCHSSMALHQPLLFQPPFDKCLTQDHKRFPKQWKISKHPEFCFRKIF